MSRGFNLSEIIQSQGLRLVFPMQDNENLKRGTLLSVFPLHLIRRARPAEVRVTAQQVSGQKSLFKFTAKALVGYWGVLSKVDPRIKPYY